ncbi:ABC transporter ATP-binding protein [Chelativorans sp. M5D2P16]|uniref:ABC transporter ATP-binding protein n=1 Tax=Chelativorans sp. M5D2P16 TaxID=3095678 RepID=UPI002ACAAB00|nr:ABC transporter ATP-binding protein [Chelativorans sp. M5D2P16]MDZ5700120.1 ABC transporter ATP-binding protein [Chelativorans sp. M5D2P16]
MTKTFGRDKAVDDLSLTVEPGRFTVLCGPPKSGKSTLFRLLVGLEKADGGRILADGVDITDLPPGGRNFGYVPQSFALYPHMTVFENIAYPLRLARAPSAEVAKRVERSAAMLSIGHLMKKTPDQLSGGEKQRVAVARGLLTNASVFVLDDPLVGLDYKLRERLMDDLKHLCEELQATFFYATADSLEALTMAQDLVVIDDGRVVEKDDVLDLYREPRFARSVELIGFPKANVWNGTARDGVVETGGLRFALPPDVPDGTVRFGLRPEDVRLDGAGEMGAKASVRIVEHLGSEIVVYLESEGMPMTAAFPSAHAALPEIDAEVRIAIDPERIMIFDAATGERIGRAQPHKEAVAHG